MVLSDTFVVRRTDPLAPMTPYESDGGTLWWSFFAPDDGFVVVEAAGPLPPEADLQARCGIHWKTDSEVPHVEAITLFRREWPA